MSHDSIAHASAHQRSPASRAPCRRARPTTSAAGVSNPRPSAGPSRHSTPRPVEHLPLRANTAPSIPAAKPALAPNELPYRVCRPLWQNASRPASRLRRRRASVTVALQNTSTFSRPTILKGD
ncbi:hypothetical protein AcV7_006223 [Taiwanofungus camphoratus]|nr:hypothetical protein AcV7_006223 [Antrodia cinnamomea]